MTLPEYPMVEHQLEMRDAYQKIANALRNHIEERLRNEGPSTVQDFARHIIAKSDKSRNMKPIENEFTTWYYGQDRDAAWCRAIPEPYEKFKHMAWVPPMRKFIW